MELANLYATFLTPDVERVLANARYQIAMLAVMEQRGFVDIAEERPDRHVCKRSKRAGCNPVPTVRVVNVRGSQRTSEQRDPDAETNAIEWSHRWVVSPHWRNQPYGPGRSKRRLTLIAPYVKGPADKPLVIKDTVRAVR